MPDKISIIAQVCHEINREYCKALGDYSQPAWEDAPEWQVKSALEGVRFHLEDPEASPSHSHDEWLREKRSNGWVYGPEKDADKKEHPCIVSFDQLPTEQKAKDYIFRAVVHAVNKVL